MLINFQIQNIPLWLGGQDILKEGNWIWQNSGDDIDYTKFQPGEPNGGTGENCMNMYYENGNWIDVNCLNALSYHVCERPAAKPTPTKPGKEGKLLNYVHDNISRFFHVSNHVALVIANLVTSLKYVQP